MFDIDAAIRRARQTLRQQIDRLMLDNEKLARIRLEHHRGDHYKLLSRRHGLPESEIRQICVDDWRGKRTP